MATGPDANVVNQYGFLAILYLLRYIRIMENIVRIILTASSQQLNLYRSTPYEFEITAPARQANFILDPSDIVQEYNIVLSPLSVPLLSPYAPKKESEAFKQITAAEDEA